MGIQEDGGAVPLLSWLRNASVLAAELWTVSSLPLPGLQEQSRPSCDHCRDIFHPHSPPPYSSVLLGTEDQ